MYAVSWPEPTLSDGPKIMTGTLAASAVIAYCETLKRIFMNG
jgi:hypothetical protein